MLGNNRPKLFSTWRTGYTPLRAPPVAPEQIAQTLERMASCLDRTEARLKRVESRLCQLMLDQGSDIHLTEETHGGR